MVKVKDSTGTTIYEGTAKACNDVLRLAYCNPADVTEADEIMYHDFLYGEGWVGKLTIDYGTIQD